jgi:hypothetical protein
VGTALAVLGPMLGFVGLAALAVGVGASLAGAVPVAEVANDVAVVLVVAALVSAVAGKVMLGRR